MRFKDFKYLMPSIDIDGDIAGGNGGEVAEPQIIDSEIEGAIETQELTDPVKQSQEDNAKYASARRESESKLKALEANQLETAQSLGYNSWDDFQEAVKAEKSNREAAAKQTRIDTYGYDPEEYVNKAVEEKLKNDPRIKGFEEAQRQANIKSVINDLNGEFNLGLKSEKDLDSLPNADKIAKLVNAGFDVKEAYSMANPGTEKKVEAAKQALLSSVSGRQHLSTSNGTANAENITIPNAIYETYSGLGWSDEKIQSTYKQLLKSTR